MSKMYEDWNKLICDQLCEEMKKFEHCKTKEQLCVIKDLIEVKNGLAEMEMDGAIRRIAEDRYGYDSSTGRFHNNGMEDAEMEFIEMFNASRGGSSRGGRRRRDSRGRYMNAVRPTTYYPYDPDMYPWDVPYMMNDGRDYSADRPVRYGDEHMMNAGRNGNGRGGNRGGSDSRGTMNDGRSYPNGSNMDDDGMYMLRQQNGMPIMTPYNMGHDVPKKLTNEQYEEWMHNMRNVDGTDGGHWTKEQIEAEAKRAGIDIKKYGALPVTVCADMIYSDYADVAAKYGVSKPSFYINMAMAFLDDDDYEGSGGGLQKLATYYYKIAKAEE